MYPTRILAVFLQGVILFSSESGLQQHDRDASADERTLIQKSSSSEETEEASKRLEFMLQVGREFEFVMPGDESPATFHTQALLRWTNPVSTVRDGILGVYLSDGRPVGFAEFQMHASGTVIHEFSIADNRKTEFRRGSEIVWIPENTWSEYHKFDNVPGPADSTVRRLLQMKRLAEKFEVVDQFGFSDDEITKYNLRLMPNPVYRYVGNGEVIDGACFVFAQGTNPEAVLLLEAIKESDRLGWRYMFVPSTIYELTVELDGDVVWKKPRYKVFDKTKGPYYAGKYKPKSVDDEPGIIQTDE